MALPEHLQPKTYWEERTALAEEAIQQLSNIVARNLPAHAMDELRLWISDWNRLLTELRGKHPAPPGDEHPALSKRDN